MGGNALHYSRVLASEAQRSRNIAGKPEQIRWHIGKEQRLFRADADQNALCAEQARPAPNPDQRRDTVLVKRRQTIDINHHRARPPLLDRIEHRLFKLFAAFSVEMANQRQKDRLRAERRYRQAERPDRRLQLHFALKLGLLGLYRGSELLLAIVIRIKEVLKGIAQPLELVNRTNGAELAAIVSMR